MSTFLTADTHFSHATVLRGCDRPFADTDEMDDALIANWNIAVHPRDTVWHLGDFGFCDSNRMAKIFYALNGAKKLVLGNHDTDKQGNVLGSLSRLPWAAVTHLAQITHEGQRVVLSHYAGLTWDAEHHGAYQAFGHSHNRLLGMPGSVDVGVDAQGFKPIGVEEFIRQADVTILNAATRIEDIVRVLRAKTSSYTEREGAIKYRERLAREADKAARRTRP